MALNFYGPDNYMPYGEFGVGIALYENGEGFGNINEKKVVKLVNAKAKSVIGTHIKAKDAECPEMGSAGDIDAFKVKASRISAGGSINVESSTVSTLISAGGKIELVGTKMQQVIDGDLHAGSVTAGGDILVRRGCSVGRVASVEGRVSIFDSEVLSVSAAVGVLLHRAVVLDTLSTEGIVEMWDSEVIGKLSCRATSLKIVNSSLNELIVKLPRGGANQNAEQRVELVNSAVLRVIFEEGTGQVIYSPSSREKSQTPYPGNMTNFF